jgi:hypothetical protein
MEASFGKATPPEAYIEYNALQEDIQKLYAAWDGLVE